MLFIESSFTLGSLVFSFLPTAAFASIVTAMITPRRIRLPSLTVSGAPTHTNGLTSKRQAFLINDDLKPVPPQLRTWSAFNYVSFWVADGFNLSSMMIASTSVSAGLAWWQAWLAVWIGYGLVAFFIAAQGRTAAVHHIGFPVLARSSFGVFGSLWPVLNRIVLAVVWYAYQSCAYDTRRLIFF